MSRGDALLTLVIALALANAFFAGFHGAAAVVSTAISSRALRPRWALAGSALAALAGPLALGTAVANTLGTQLIAPEALSERVLLAAMSAALAWILFTWQAGIPCSASQALVGGLLGAATTAAGPDMIQRGGLLKTLWGLFLSPPLGLLAGWLMMRLVLALAQTATPRVSYYFKQGQALTSLGLAMVVGSNDAQKLMGMIALALLLNGRSSDFRVPLWVTLACGGAFAAGMLSGGYRLMRTLGLRIFKIRPVHGFSAQLAAALVVCGASLMGLPVSSTQVISTAIFGVGSAERLSRVRWQVAGELITAWVLTIPMTALLAGLGWWLTRGWR